MLKRIVRFQRIPIICRQLVDELVELRNHLPIDVDDLYQFSRLSSKPPFVNIQGTQIAYLLEKLLQVTVHITRQSGIVLCNTLKV